MIAVIGEVVSLRASIALGDLVPTAAIGREALT
jgi:hypothetical protein